MTKGVFLSEAEYRDILTCLHECNAALEYQIEHDYSYHVGEAHRFLGEATKILKEGYDQ